MMPESLRHSMPAPMPRCAPIASIRSTKSAILTAWLTAQRKPKRSLPHESVMPA